MKNTRHLFASALITSMLSTSALADKLDDIVDNGELRCAVTLDNGQAGFRDADNQPAGFDVDYCNDLAAAMGVKAVIVETPLPSCYEPHNTSSTAFKSRSWCCASSGLSTTS